MRCDVCGGEFAGRADARFCSSRCRVAAYRRRLPGELTGRARWIRRTGTKVPITASNRAASVSDPSTWSTFDDADSSPAGVGLGFVLNGDGVACVDFDHIGKRIPSWLAAWLREHPTFVEWSPSGDGLHVWGFTAGGWRSGRHGGVECYGDGRYITVTRRPHRLSVPKLGDIDSLVALLDD